ncbi:MAG: dihydrolipoyl dehydrogenase [Desulfomonilaceae bacterium]
MAKIYDMAVIGGGPGGYVTALRARQLGLSVVLAEKEKIGGVCLNRGCIPTKTLLADADGLHWARRAAKEGILGQQLELSFAGMMERKNRVVGKLVANLEELLAAKGIEVIYDKAKIAEPGAIITQSGQLLKCRNIVVATGSRSWAPPIPGVDLPGVLSTRQILELEQVPERLIIIGGGVIGQEFAAIFSALGSKVTVLEVLNRILCEVDTEIARRYASLLPGYGVHTELSARVRSIEKAGDLLRVVYEKKDKEKACEADTVLMATGRKPCVEDFGLSKTGVAIENGAIDVDRRLRTSVDGIYAIGDVTGRKMLAHVASYHGEITAENIAGSERDVEDDLAPACVFTIPQIACVGLTEDQAKESGRPFRTSMVSLASSGKAQAMGEARGWLKLIEDSATGRLIGAHFLGPQVSELIGGITLAIRKGLSASDIIDTIYPHPTLSEFLREAALGFSDGPIHAGARTRSSGD